ncbi:MAG: beta-galactosidase [Patescibacteria group bacterium]
MIKKIFKIATYFLIGLIILVVSLLAYFNFPFAPEKEADFGVTFSKRYAGELGLDWRETYLAILDDLGVKKIRIPAYWDEIEKEEGVYDFRELDWQIDEAEKRNVEVILAVGQKVPRWPECFIPEWGKNDDAKRKARLLYFVQETIERYRHSPAIRYWQVENEPFLPFGNCPELDENLLDLEIDLARKLDPSRPVIITDSGELSFWIPAASRADVFGTTMYLKIWSKNVGYFTYPIGPRFFHFKKKLVDIFSGKREIINVELQAEPWIEGATWDKTLEEQLGAMNIDQFKKNLVFAKKAGFSPIYLWGAEWWYYLKIKNGYPLFWEEAKKIFHP